MVAQLYTFPKNSHLKLGTFHGMQIVQEEGCFEVMTYVAWILHGCGMYQTALLQITESQTPMCTWFARRHRGHLVTVQIPHLYPAQRMLVLPVEEP